MEEHEYGLEIYPGVLLGVCSYKWKGERGFYLYLPLICFYYKIFTDD